MAFLTDSSTNNFELTAFGNAAIQTAVSKYGGGAIYFDGDGDYLQLAATDTFNFYNYDFTIEGWIYSAANQTGGAIISTRLGGVYSPWELQIGFPNVNRISLLIQSDGSSWYSNAFYGTTVLPTNQWVHIAWVCQNGNHTVYINGVADSSLTNLNAPILQSFAQPSNIYIGKGGDGDFNGYIDDLRITKGIARYTSNFVPPSAQFADPSDPYGDNVSLLLHMDTNDSLLEDLVAFYKLNNENDNSGNGYTLTNNNSVQFVAGKIGDCAEFDGSNYLSNNSVSVAGKSFTVSKWIYAPSSQSSIFSETVSRWSSANSNSTFVMGINEINNTNGFFAYCRTQSGSFRVTTPMIYDEWAFFAIRVTNGISIELFKNGVLVDSMPITGNIILNNGSTQFQIGAGESSGQWKFTGKLDAIGVWARALTDQEITTLYNSGNGLEKNSSNLFIDSSINNFELTAFGNAQISTATKKFGNGAAYFDGNGDYVEATPNDAFAFSTNDFTVEGWLYPTNMDNDYHVFFDTRLSDGSLGSSVTMFLKSDQTLHVLMNSDESFIVSSPLTLNTWTHFALVKSNGDHKLYINGIQNGSTNSNATNCTTNYLTIGKTAESLANYYFGYIDELRVTKGVARYTSNFVPQTAPFANPIPPFPTQDLLAFWRLADLTDSSGNGNNLVNTNNVQFVAGKIGDCAEFNGSNYLSTSNTFSLNQVTFSCWFKNTGSPSLGIGTGYPNQYRIVSIGGDVYFQTPDAVTANTTSASLNDSNWHFCVGTSDGTTSKLYIDGILVDTSSVSYSAPAAAQFRIGSYEDGLATNGTQLDTVGLWSRALTDQEIQTLYNNGNGREL